MVGACWLDDLHQVERTISATYRGVTTIGQPQAAPSASLRSLLCNGTLSGLLGLSLLFPAEGLMEPG